MAALTTANGVEYTKKVAGGIANMVGKLWDNDVKMIFDTYTVPTATLDATAELNMGIVPKGARVLGFIFAADDNDAATTGTIEVGGTSAITAATITALDSGPVSLRLPALAPFHDTPLTADAIVSIQFAAQDIKATVQISLTTLYVMDV